ncbi:DUF11 domain-containing protein [Candidatus Saccharibacteria bacterium]|nr:DUF11 domain-containing protein [Candidatus Saccharibacteria bacterium]
MNKLRSIITALKYAPKKVAAIFLLLAAILVPATIIAWGPNRTTFTMEKPATYVTFNSITNNPSVGDERNFVVIREVGATAWADVATMQEGKEYDIRMYVHNNAADNLGLVAHNVRAALNLPRNNYVTEFEVNGFISADNANPTKIWDNLLLQSDKEFRVQVVSAKYYNNITGSSLGRQLGDELFTNANGGAQLGYISMNGEIPGCLQYAGYIIVRIKPEFKVTPAPSYDVDKKVDNKTHNAVAPGGTMTYTITAKNTGNVELTNVKINDTLPAYYQSASETITSPAGHTGSIINSGSVTLTKLPVGATATITISYKVKGESAFECGKTTNFINKVTSTSDQKNTEDRTDNNQVDTDVTYQCTPPPIKVPNFDLEKSVDKTTAKPGETLNYTLTFRNTGEVDLTNVVIKDTLPAGLTYVSGSINASTTYTGDLFGSGMTIAKVAVGGTVTITFRAKINTNAVPAEQCGENQKQFTNKSSSTTNEKTDESNKNNNNATTTVTVNKNCDEPSYDVVKTVDKATASPGETLIYTITVKNTGNADLTNIVVKDILPNYIASAKSTTTAPSAISGDLFKAGVTIAKLQPGEIATITITAVVKAAAQLPCGDSILINKVTSSTNEVKNEDNLDNNTAKTTVNKDCPPTKKPCPTNPKLDIDDPGCKPCVYNPSLNYDDPNCVPPTEPKKKCPYNQKLDYDSPDCVPPTIVATGPAETIATIISTGALTFGAVAYTRSRRDLTSKLLNK